MVGADAADVVAEVESGRIYEGELLMHCRQSWRTEKGRRVSVIMIAGDNY